MCVCTSVAISALSARVQMPGYHRIPHIHEAMPGYHIVAGAKSYDDMKGYEVLSTCGIGVVETYDRDGPITAFDFPMNDLSKRAGTRSMTYEQMWSYLDYDGDDWWLMRVYANYDNNLDAYVIWGRLPGMVYHYELYVPDYLYEGVLPDESTGVYADPKHWFLAYARELQHCYTDDEFAMYQLSLGSAATFTMIGD